MPPSLTAFDPASPTRSSAPLGWQAELKHAIRDPHQLMQQLGLPGELVPSTQACQQFPLFVTRPFAARMKPGDPHDPLLRQVFPFIDEERADADFVADPLHECVATSGGALVQKYAGRALVVATGACAIHCRYCFRRHFPYDQLPKGWDQWGSQVIQRIAADESMHEVLLSGGDPLMLTDSHLDRFITALESIAHVRRIRIHTRLPIVLPQRITPALVDRLAASRLTVWIAIHTNHAQEIDSHVQQAIASLIDAGIPLLNQSVLLKGVNDQLASLVELSQRLIDMRVTPYYLHHLDRVAGASHFAVPQETGQQLVDAMRSQLPGYAVPRFVMEQPGENAKTLIR